jgi:2-keto-3-deoxy-L-rhamnonate aldolase RhmA
MNSPSPVQLGTWLSVGSPAIAELAGLCGFAWVLLDLEHGCAGESALPDQLRALAGSGTKGIVRVGAPQPDLIARVLDWGADGIMVPRVESAAEAEAVVAAANHAPRGRRGYSSTVRATGYGLRPHPVAPLLMAQIENRRGVGAATEIAAVDGISTLFLGPADLRHDLEHGHGTDTGELGLDFDGCLETVLAASRAAGTEAGILVRDPAEIAATAARGFSRIAVESDLSILRKAYRSILS